MYGYQPFSHHFTTFIRSVSVDPPLEILLSTFWFQWRQYPQDSSIHFATILLFSRSRKTLQSEIHLHFPFIELLDTLNYFHTCKWKQEKQVCIFLLWKTEITSWATWTLRSPVCKPEGFCQFIVETVWETRSISWWRHKNLFQKTDLLFCQVQTFANWVNSQDVTAVITNRTWANHFCTRHTHQRNSSTVFTFCVFSVACTCFRCI